MKKPIPIVTSQSLKKTTKTTDVPPWIITLYGPSGIGKSSFGAQFSNCGFLIGAKERGIQILSKYQRVPDIKYLWEADDWIDALCILENVPKDCETLVIDSLTILETMCFTHHCNEEFDGDWSSEGFLAFQRGPKNASRTEWPKFTEAVEELNNRGMNVLMIAHSKQKMYSNPIGSDYEIFCPTLENPTWDAVHPFSHAVLFYRNYVEVVEAKGIKKGKASDDEGGRNIYTEASPAYFAKNWMGLSPIIDAGTSAEEAHQNFTNALQKAYSKKR